MEKGSFYFSSEALLSHPDKLLSDHLLQVSKLARQFSDECECPLTARINFAEIASLIGSSHDLGKATPYFQQYIRERDPVRRRKQGADPRTKHGLISALVAYWLVDAQVRHISAEQQGLDFLPYAAYLVVKHHHGNLDTPLNSVIIDDRKEKLLLEQWHSMNKDAFRSLLELIGIGYAYELISRNFGSLKANLINRLQLRPRLRNISTYEYYYLVNTLYSIVIDADKTDVGIGSLPARAKIAPDVVNIYRQKRGWDQPQSNIDSIRNQVYFESASRIEDMDLKHYILSMNVPTGLGKTLAAFNCALKLRRRIESVRNYAPRIIYALPFLSIIEQNFDSISHALGEEAGSNILLKHHHLSDVFYKDDDDDERKISESELLTEGWNSEIIVTTFVQLFHTLIGYRNRSLRKLHRIANSIIILDEIQSLPHKYWLLLRDVMNYLSENMQVYFIMVTATKPLIFADHETYELIEEPKRYFDALDRIGLEAQTCSKIKLEEFREMLAPEIEARPSSRFLVVMNTIRSAEELYSWLDERFDSVSYLSTHIIPKHRMERITRARDSKDIRVLVSTQLIEAGVDIDFDVVYRDFAPLDSINQSAGRCNRNMRDDDKGIVRVVKLIDQTARTYASRIYDDLLIRNTELSLPAGTKVRESEFIMRNNEYYNLVSRTMSDDESKDILKSVRELNYDGSDHSVSEFKLIKEEYEKIDIFVEVDDEAIDKWKKYEALRNIEDWRKRREEFLKIRATFYQYVISVALNYAKDNLPPFVNGIYYIPKAQICQYYSKKTGFIRKGGTLMF